MKNRNEINEEFKIDTTSLYENNDAFEKDLEKVSGEINEISKYNNRLYEDKNLYEALKLNEELLRKIFRLYTYAHLNNDFELSVNIYNEYREKVVNLLDKYNSLSSYMVPELLEKDYSYIEELYKKDEKLKEFEVVLKNIFRTKKHILSKSEEYVITKLVIPYGIFEDAYSKLRDVDLKFGKIKINGKEEELTPILYFELSESHDRDLRKESFLKLYEGYKSVINTNAELIKGNVKKNNAISEVRKYSSALEKSLDANDVDISVYNTLLKSINKNIDIIHKQWQVHKNALGVDKLYLYDVYAPIVKDYVKEYSLDEAKELVVNSLNVMGEEYVSVIKRAFDERWIDIYPNKNKRGGAYCTHCYDTHPYVLSNYDGKFNDVSTLSHELGHAMQYYYADLYNSYTNADYSIFVAEVASQVNEILLNLYIIDNSKDENEILTIYNNLIRQFKASVVRQTMFAEFEKTIHEADANGIALSVDYLNNEYYKLNQKYYGTNVEINDEIKYEWSRIPHFYYNFYVYQYATGYIAALKLATDIYNKKDNALENYMKFLKLGCTKDPVESLRIAGVDLTDEKTFDAAFAEFTRELDKLDDLIKKA